MWRENRKESLAKPHLAHVDLLHFCPCLFCRDGQHRLEVEPPLVVRSSAPSKPVLQDEIALYSDGAEARPKLCHVIIEAELIKGLEAAEEYWLVKVPRGRRPSKGHMLVRDWQGTEIIVNMKGS
jgi:hypothetical protein